MQLTGVCSISMPLRHSYEHQNCSVAATLELVGERWTLLIVREVLLGVHRFCELQTDLGVARNVLQVRLERLVEHGILERRRYQQHPPRDGYHLTEKGLDLWPTIVALMQWGDRHLPRSGGPPVEITHRGCGGAMDAHRTCTNCGARLGPRNVWAAPGASAGPEHPLRRRRASPGPRMEGNAHVGGITLQPSGERPARSG
jgi:DNA-binding HxlR family transcriptional regulator